MLAIAIPAGLLIGLSLGALGGGGSILTVPALVYLLHQPAHAATTGSLPIVGITALVGMTAHLRADRAEPEDRCRGHRGRAASRVDASRLIAAFTVLLAAVAVDSTCRSLPGLV